MKYQNHMADTADCHIRAKVVGCDDIADVSYVSILEKTDRIVVG